MLNIVSIDFDIIMAPSIELYNSMVNPGCWEENFLSNPQLQLSYADLMHYQKITQWMLNIIPKMDKNNIHFIFNHESLIRYVPQEEKEVIITNIDHHHDISYNKQHAENVIDYDNLTCGNWVKYLYDAKQLKRYYWVNNNNSQPPSPDNPNIIQHTTDLSKFNFSTLATPDKLIICLSPMWVPTNYRNLFFTWMDICNFIHNTHFDIEDA